MLEPVYYYAYGDPTTSSPTDYRDIYQDGNGYISFVRVSEDNIGTANKEVYIVRNGKLGCFKNNDYDNQQYLVQAFFSDVTCTVYVGTDINSVGCNAPPISCGVFSDGRVNCIIDYGDEDCNVISSGDVYC